jgi:hypothetical protein
MVDLLLIGVILFFASFVQGFSGFGFGLIVTPLLALFYPISFVVPFTALCGLVINVILVYELKPELKELKLLLPLSIGVILGVPIGVYALSSSEETLIRLLLSLLLVGYAGYALMVREIKKELGSKSAVVAGWFSGWFGAALATGGPPIIIFVSLQPWEKRRAKSTLVTFLFFSTILIVMAHTVAGLTTAASVESFFYAIPVIATGTFVGSHIFGRTDHIYFRKAVLILLLFIGGLIFPYGG